MIFVLVAPYAFSIVELAASVLSHDGRNTAEHRHEDKLHEMEGTGKPLTSDACQAATNIFDVRNT